MTTMRWLGLYLARRVGGVLILLILVSIGIFSLLYISPGNPIDVLLGPVPRSPETIAILTSRYHLDASFFDQYWIWLTRAVTGDFGTSIQTSLPVIDEINIRYPTTVFLGVYAFILTVVIGAGLGVVSALRRGTNIDRFAVVTAIAGMSVPSFVIGVLLLFLFAITLPWFPASGGGTGFAGMLWHLTLPALALAIGCAAYIARHVRAAFIRILDEDYVVFARARGLSSRRIFFTYLGRNALIPIITISGIILGYLIVGSVLIEVTFSISGIGQLLVRSANAKDIPMLQAVALLMAAVVMLMNLLTDVIYMFVDPRVRVGGKK